MNMKIIDMIKKAIKLFSDICISVFCSTLCFVKTYAGVGVIGSVVDDTAGSMFNIVTKLAVSIAALMITISGVKIIWGSQKAAEEGKSVIIKTSIGIGITVLAPSLVRMAISLAGGNDNGWGFENPK